MIDYQMVHKSLGTALRIFAHCFITHLQHAIGDHLFRETTRLERPYLLRDHLSRKITCPERIRVFIDHLSLETTLAVHKGWLPKTGSTVRHVVGSGVRIYSLNILESDISDVIFECI